MGFAGIDAEHVFTLENFRTAEHGPIMLVAACVLLGLLLLGKLQVAFACLSRPFFACQTVEKCLSVPQHRLLPLLDAGLIDYLLRRPRGSSILLLGPAGSGKTMLYLQVILALHSAFQFQFCKLLLALKRSCLLASSPASAFHIAAACGPGLRVQ